MSDVWLCGPRGLIDACLAAAYLYESDPSGDGGWRLSKVPTRASRQEVGRSYHLSREEPIAATDLRNIAAANGHGALRPSAPPPPSLQLLPHRAALAATLAPALGAGDQVEHERLQMEEVWTVRDAPGDAVLRRLVHTGVPREADGVQIRVHRVSDTLYCRDPSTKKTGAALFGSRFDQA